jgi:excisionase family DNA binding protein
MKTADRLLTPGEVAKLFRVDPKTVTRWAAAGRIGSIRTPGGHRRFRESEVKALLEGGLDFYDDSTPGEPFVSEAFGPRPGYVVGTCGHAVAQSEWNAGFKKCERC